MFSSGQHPLQQEGGSSPFAKDSSSFFDGRGLLRLKLRALHSSVAEKKALCHELRTIRSAVEDKFKRLHSAAKNKNKKTKKRFRVLSSGHFVLQ